MNEIAQVRLEPPPTSTPLTPKAEQLPARRRSATLPIEFVRLFHAIEALRTPEPSAGIEQGMVVQFIAAEPGAGTSTIAAGYARVAASERGRPVLLVDCAGGENRGQRPSLAESFGNQRLASQAMQAVEGVPNLVLARFSAELHPLLDIGGAQIGPLLAALKREFSLVVLDCPAATVADAAALARHADGTVLVAAAGRSRADSVRAARTEIERLGGQIVGCVFNHARRPLPRWLAWLP